MNNCLSRWISRVQSIVDGLNSNEIFSGKSFLRIRTVQSRNGRPRSRGSVNSLFTAGPWISLSLITQPSNHDDNIIASKVSTSQVEGEIGPEFELCNLVRNEEKITKKKNDIFWLAPPICWEMTPFYFLSHHFSQPEGASRKWPKKILTRKRHNKSTCFGCDEKYFRGQAWRRRSNSSFWKQRTGLLKTIEATCGSSSCSRAFSSGLRVQSRLICI